MAKQAHTTSRINSANSRDRIRRDDRRMARAAKRAWLELR